jgi:hypothetical protein
MKNAALAGCFLVLALLSFTCKSQNGLQKKSEKLIMMASHGCRGYCPVYILTFFENGDLHYKGIRFVQDTGMITTGITPEELAQLKMEVAKTNLWQYPEVIESQVADAPGSTMTVYNGAKSHQVSGSIDRPAQIIVLEKLMKKLAEDHGFHVTRGIDPGAPPPGYEIIVLLKEDVNAGNWIGDYKELRLQLVRRLGAENKWLVAYDPGKSSEKKLLERLKEDKEVVSAQGNKKTEERN